MPKIAYREQRFNGKARKTLEQAKVILDDLTSQGYVPTLRQLYYQFVRRNWLPNRQQEYKRLGRIICDAREVGEVDWLHIEDRGRGAVRFSDCPDYEDAFDGLEGIVSINPWDDQDVYLEVAVEKDAQVGIVARPASRWRAPYIACKGYLSASEAWRMGLRFQRAIAAGKRPILVHLGDHDPSGLHMTDDNRDRLAMFARQSVEVRRIALNMDQVEEHDCPPNPAKMTDTRAAGYVERFGQESWELDALPPKYLDDLIADTIEGYVDKEAWRRSLEREAELREPLSRFKHRWQELIELVGRDELPLRRLDALDRLLPDVEMALRTGSDGVVRAASKAGGETLVRALTELVKAKPEGGEYETAAEQGAFEHGVKQAGRQVNATQPAAIDDEDGLLSEALERSAARLAQVEWVPFELPEYHDPPKAQMPWDEVDEADALPEGYTDEDDEGLLD